MAERARLGPLALRLSRRERPAPVSRGRATGGVVRDAALLFALLSLPAAAEPVTLVIVDRVINTGTEPLPRLDTWLACPPSDADQRIDALVISPAPDSVETTAHGQQVARWCGLSLAPGATIASRMVIDATLDPGQNSPPEPLSAAERALYLADGPKYHLGSERIRTSAAEIAPDARGPQAKVAAIFDYVVDHLSYSRDGTWDAAGAVLERGKGSCSEYVFTFVALCRAKGIPARFVGGTARRTGSSLHVDRVWHRWAEAYIDGLGWQAFDPTRSGGADRYHRYFGRPPDDVLALVRGDGTDGPPLGWRYDAYHEWDRKRSDIKAQRRGWWIPTPSAEVRQRVAELARDVTATRARAIGHPFVLPWLDDLLYDPPVRVEAARAMRDIGGPPVVPALIDCLERAADPAGDEAIVAILNEWTGQKLGAKRADWDAWTRTAAFRAFTAPGREGEER